MLTRVQVLSISIWVIVNSKTQVCIKLHVFQIHANQHSNNNDEFGDHERCHSYG